MSRVNIPPPYKNLNQVFKDAKLHLRSLKSEELSIEEVEELQAAQDRLFMLDGLQAVEILMHSKAQFNTYLATLVQRS